VAGILLLLAQRQGGIEAGLANFTRLLPIGFAFSAGMVASVNPCGVVMLTTYAFQRMGEARQKTAGRQVLESIAHTLAITLSFVIIFLGVGSLIAAGSQALLDYFPLAGLLIGVAMTVVGTWLFIKRKTLSLNLEVKQDSGAKLSVWSDLLFGLSYAVASLSCTLPIFLVVAGNALSAGDFPSAVAQFGAYALGMGAVVLVVVLGAVLFKRALARWLRGVTPFVHRLSSLFLAGAGVYIVIYWLNQGILF
jgi:cytochrome c-type biogenesis protein